MCAMGIGTNRGRGSRALRSGSDPAVGHASRSPCRGTGRATGYDSVKDTLARDAYCMDVDKVEYRIDPEGRVTIVSIYELIRWDWHHDLDDIPERLAPYQGKVALLRRISAAIPAGQGASFPTFFVWHRPDLSEFVVSPLEEWVGGSRKALGLGCRAFAGLIGDLPGWEGGTTALASARGRRSST